MTTLNKTFQSNPDPCPGSENLGHVAGQTKDGSYFEAELWVWGEQLCASFLLNEKWQFAPESEFMAERAEKKAVDAGELAYVHVESDRSELIQGMVIRNDSLTLEETARYVKYLTEMGLLEFLTDVFNGYAQALTDVCGNDVVQCIITLESAEFGAEAATSLQFEPFEGPKKLDSSDFRVVTCGAEGENENCNQEKWNAPELIDQASKAIAAIPDNEDMADLVRIEYEVNYGYFQEGECDDDVADRYNRAYECTYKNKAEIQNGKLCSCLNCSRTFPPSYIYRWVDDGQTAVCPYCGVDIVFSHNSVDFPVDEFFAEALGTYGESQTI